MLKIVNIRHGDKPMPRPNKNERKEDFISRCIPEVMGEGKTQEQAAAICYIYWDEKNKADIKRAINNYIDEDSE